VVIESQAFAGTPKVARQRLVYRALAEELAGPVHALSVKALAPGEAA
jgi:BolA protein